MSRYALLAFAACQFAACGGSLGHDPIVSSSGGSPQASGGGAANASGAANISGAANVSGAGASAAGSAGAGINPGSGCAEAAARACLMKIGSSFIDYELNGAQRRYSHGCNPQCSDVELPTQFYPLDGTGPEGLLACDGTDSITLINGSGPGPGEVDLCSASGCQKYKLINGAGFAQQFPNVIEGTATATNEDDASDTGTIKLSFNVCGS